MGDRFSICILYSQLLPVPTPSCQSCPSALFVSICSGRPGNIGSVRTKGFPPNCFLFLDPSLSSRILRMTGSSLADPTCVQVETSGCHLIQGLSYIGLPMGIARCAACSTLMRAGGCLVRRPAPGVMSAQSILEQPPRIAK